MTVRVCPRAWEAEAIADGRLSDAARSSFERHAATCRECAREATALDELARIGRRIPTREATPLARRRLRQSILRHAYAGAFDDPRRPARVASGIAIAAALILAVAALLVRRVPAPSSTRAAIATPVFEARPSLTARYHAEVLGPRVRVSLEAGSVAFHVAKLGPDQRFVVRLPDGELEVRGTRFTIDVTDGHTQSVVVNEGRVALRLESVPERLIAAGESWTRSSASEQPAARAVAAPPTAVATNQPPRHAMTPPSLRVAGGVPIAAPAASSTPGGESARTVNDQPDALTSPSEFSSAMQAFNAGDYARADALFAAFTAHHPADARSEDAAFLRAVSHAQRGDSAGAAALAREYLARYPHGFRRAEAERLAH